MSHAQLLDMSETPVNVLHMSKMIQIRNVPDDLHKELKMRAAAAGMSLSDYIKRELSGGARKSTIREIAARSRRRPSSGVNAQRTVEILREMRGD
jgi:plasmid stability protein